jgi:hypothetical protein
VTCVPARHEDSAKPRRRLDEHGKTCLIEHIVALQSVEEKAMLTKSAVRFLVFWLLVLLFAGRADTYGQQNPTMGEVGFSADNQAERDSGVWIDGKYAGYVKELKGNRKVKLPPGEHEISVRQAGYKDFTKKLVVEPGQIQIVAVVMEEDTKAIYPGADAAELRLDIRPKRAAVFVDNGYLGHGSDFGGRFHSMLVSPGKHQLKITLDGYRTYESEINVLAKQKSRMKIVLEKSDSGADHTNR